MEVNVEQVSQLHTVEISYGYKRSIYFVGMEEESNVDVYEIWYECIPAGEVSR